MLCSIYSQMQVKRRKSEENEVNMITQEFPSSKSNLLSVSQGRIQVLVISKFLVQS